MNPPSADAIAAVTEVLELASLLDSRLPRPDKGRILAWAKQLHRHPGLQRDDLLDAVQSFYDRPSPQPISVGDVIDGARRIKRDRLDREADQDREHRQQVLETKAADAMAAIAADFVTGTVAPTDRLTAAENALQCCTNKAESIAAIREFFAAKAEAAATK